MGSKSNGKGAPPKGGYRDRQQKLDAKKAGEADSAAASAQSTLNLPKQRDLEHHVTAYEIAKAKVDKSNADLRNVCKQAEEAGVDVKSMKAGLTLLRKDPLAAKVYLNQLSMVLSLKGSPTQFATFDTKSGSLETEAKIRGHADAEAGRTAENPYPSGSEAGKAYSDAFLSQRESAIGAA